jgi:WASH complex subunit 7
MKDLKYFRDNKERLNQNYSYERAEAFSRGIRKLGLSPTGESYLDLFRTLISHIGNAMGYVRMIRSGGFHSCSEACVYLPTLETFDIVEPDTKYSESFDEAFKNLQDVVKNLSNNYVEGTEYFQVSKPQTWKTCFLYFFLFPYSYW